MIDEDKAIIQSLILSISSNLIKVLIFREYHEPVLDVLEKRATAATVEQLTPLIIQQTIQRRLSV